MIRTANRQVTDELYRHFIRVFCITVCIGNFACSSSESDELQIDDSSTVFDSESSDSQIGSDALLDDNGTASDTATDMQPDDFLDSASGSAAIPLPDDGDTATDSQTLSPETWTVMIYMAADSDLEAALLADLNELRAVETPQWLNVLILFDRHTALDTSDGNWTGTRLFRVTPGMPSGLERIADPTYLKIGNTGDSDELDMGDGATLDGFLRFAESAYAADHYALILSGHGSGLMKKDFETSSYVPQGICSDASGTTDGMSVQDALAPALQSHEIDVLGFDACLMGMVEVVWAVKDHVQYVIASEANESADGWDYKNWLSDWIERDDRSPRTFAEQQVLSYQNYYTSVVPPFQVTVSVVETSKLSALGDAINGLYAQYALDEFIYQALTFDDVFRDYYDLWSIADLTGDATLKSAIENVVIYNWFSDGEGAPGGLSIMFVERFPNAYLNTSFCQDLDWC